MPLPILVIHRALEVLTWLIIVDVVLTYIPSVRQSHRVVVLIRRITRPIVSPFRKIIPPQRIGDAYLDFSPLLALIAISIVDRLIG